jgi:hypothetical protein
MIESHLTYTEAIKPEPSLDDYLRSDEIDLSDILSESFSEMCADIKDRGNELRRLCIRLALQSSTTQTAAYDSQKTTQDYAQRNRVVIKVTAITGNAVFTIQGTNDSSSETWTDIETQTITAIGTTTFLINEYYKFYRLRLISIGNTITYSAYMLESTYEYIQRLKFLAMAFEKLSYKAGDDNFQIKSDKYREMYQKKIDSTRFYYDEDDDNDIREEEVFVTTNLRLVP